MSWRRAALGRALVLAVAVASVATAGCSKGKAGAGGAANPRARSAVMRNAERVGPAR